MPKTNDENTVKRIEETLETMRRVANNDDIHAAVYVRDVSYLLKCTRATNETRIAELEAALRGVAIMLNTELERYESEPWAQRVRAALAEKE